MSRLKAQVLRPHPQWDSHSDLHDPAPFPHSPPSHPFSHSRRRPSVVMGPLQRYGHFSHLRVRTFLTLHFSYPQGLAIWELICGSALGPNQQAYEVTPCPCVTESCACVRVRACLYCCMYVRAMMQALLTLHAEHGGKDTLKQVPGVAGIGVTCTRQVGRVRVWPAISIS